MAKPLWTLLPNDDWGGVQTVASPRRGTVTRPRTHHHIIITYTRANFLDRLEGLRLSA